jgi:glycosyltransferase involved in cell wall biosynthesis
MRSSDGARLPAVSVVIPAYNEERSIAAEVRHVAQVLDRSGRASEIIVVDDGSTDGTGDCAAGEGVQVIRLPQNTGYGNALKRGIATSRYDWVLITDADGTYPAEAIPRLLAHIPDHDMVVGARTGEEVHIPLIRRPAKWFLRRLAVLLARHPIPDLNSGLRIMRKSVVQRFEGILPRGFSFTTTITLAMLSNGYSVAYEPIDYRRRVGSSKIRPTDTFRFLIQILRVSLRFQPQRVFLPLGAVLGVVGGLMLLRDMLSSGLSGQTVACLLGAALIWGLGLLAHRNAQRTGMRERQ